MQFYVSALVLSVLLATPVASFADCNIATRPSSSDLSQQVATRTLICDEPPVPTAEQLREFKLGCKQIASAPLQTACQESFEKMVKMRRSAWLRRRLEQGMPFEDAARKLKVPVEEVEAWAAENVVSRRIITTRAPRLPADDAELESLRQMLEQARYDRGL